ncbi:MAG: T9SS type A sorting domain-containing protein [Bacteroidales bacterium]|nr:T9SS type A sorting domain-containing protein [Bacteroidales bacterium]
MKKLYFVIMLCVAALFSANAQSAETVSVKDLNYRFISKLPFTIEDAITSTDPILADMDEGHAAKGYAFTLTAKTDLCIRLTRITTSQFDPEIFLLNDKYEEVTSNDQSDSGSCIVARLDAGTYYIIAVQNSSTAITSDKKYTLSVSETAGKLMKELTYKPITHFPDTVMDTIAVEMPYLLDGRAGCRAFGYSVSLAANEIIKAGVVAKDIDMYMFLLDKNYNVVVSSDYDWSGDYKDASIIYQAPTAGTYYFVLTSYTVDLSRGGFAVAFDKAEMKTYYIDPVNGDDAATGITPARPVKTLDAAIDQSKGIGTYYLMNDYELGMTGYPAKFVVAKIYPYQKNIRLSIAKDFDEVLLQSSSALTLGDAQGSNYFIMDSVTTTALYAFLSYGRLELNNVKISHSEFSDYVFLTQDIATNNCEFKNVKAGTLFMQNLFMEGVGFALKNTNIQECQLENALALVFSSGTPYDAWLENCQITNNTFEGGGLMASRVNLNLKGGSWQYNTLTEIPDVSFKAKLNKANLAGIVAAEGTTIMLSKDYVMDINNFIVLDETSLIYVNDNYTSNQVATILPMKNTDSDDLGYEEGRQVLTGTRNMLNANYQKFALAQVADDIWYLRADGKIYLTPVGIKENVLANTVIYPNPVTDMATVSIANVEVTDLAIIDAYGRLVMSSKVSGDTETLNLSGLSSGMYFVQFRDHNTILGTQKIIKK